MEQILSCLWMNDALLGFLLILVSETFSLDAFLQSIARPQCEICLNEKSNFNLTQEFKHMK